MIFGFCFSKNLKIQIVFFQMIHYFEHYFNIYISTSMDQILWNAPYHKKLFNFIYGKRIIIAKINSGVHCTPQNLVWQSNTVNISSGLGVFYLEMLYRLLSERSIMSYLHVVYFKKMSGASATYLKIHQKLVSNLSTKHFKALADSFNKRFMIIMYVWLEEH